MARINVKQSDPARYAQIRAEQQALEKAHSSSVKMARLCPYCDHKIEILCRGTHSGTYTKCPNCGETIFFPPVSFRRAR